MDAAYPDLYYVEALIAPDTVDTMPPEVPLKPHFDGPRVREHIASLLRARTCLPRE